MTRNVLTHGRITPALREALHLPSGTWQLVVNRAMTAASYMDGRHRVHHIEIDDVKRQQLKTIATFAVG